MCVGGRGVRGSRSQGTVQAPLGASASLQEGAQTNWVLPSSLRDFSALRGRCLPQKKHDIVAALKTPVDANGEPEALLW